MRPTQFLAGVATAAVLAVQTATAQGPIREIGAVGPAQMIQILKGGAAPADAGPVTRGSSTVDQVSAPRATAGLTIIATFDGTITSDPNAAAIEATINTAIANIQSMFSDPITVSITFEKMSSGLGQSSSYYYNILYGTFLSALKADSTTSDDATATAFLPSVSTNPVNGSSTINVKTAGLRAVGINGFNPPTGEPDGTISLNLSITSPGSPGSTAAFNLLPVVEHEIDEVLGLGSSLPDVSLGTVFPEDLFRYDQTGTRTFTTTSSAKAFFSIDGSTALAQFDNQNDGGDFGDWQSNPLPSGVSPKVQDAFATRGANPALSVELTALDVIGFDRITNTAPIITSNPANQTISYGTTAILSVTASGGGLSYQWYRGTSEDTTNPISGATSSSYATAALISNTKYWVRVANVGGSASSSTAKVTVQFTDPVLTALATVIKAAHFTEVRTRIDAQRVRFGMGTFSYTHPTLTPGVSSITFLDLNETRLALSQVYSNQFGILPAYSTSPGIGGTARVADISDIRAFTLQLEDK